LFEFLDKMPASMHNADATAGQVDGFGAERTDERFPTTRLLIGILRLVVPKMLG
jgi:hypothetical protein